MQAFVKALSNSLKTNTKGRKKRIFVSSEVLGTKPVLEQNKTIAQREERIQMQHSSNLKSFKTGTRF